MTNPSVGIDVVTNVPAPYRDAAFAVLTRMTDCRIFMLADDEPGRAWSGRRTPYAFHLVPGAKLRIRGRVRYIPFPSWLIRSRRRTVIVAGFGFASLLTALFAPQRCFIWSEATDATEAGVSSMTTRYRRCLVRRARGAVAVGRLSEQYLRALGARALVRFPNTLGTEAPAQGHAADSPPMVLLHVGRWSESKGAHRSVAVWRRLQERIDDEVSLLIAGHQDDVALPEGAEYLGFIQSEDVWSTVMSKQPRLTLVLSDSEHWGYSMHEAMSYGVVPVAHPQVAAATELLGDAEVNLLAESVEEVADISFRLLTDDELHRRLSQWCKDRAYAVDAAAAVDRLLRDLAELH